jgi:hypothetical protein
MTVDVKDSTFPKKTLLNVIPVRIEINEIYYLECFTFKRIISMKIFTILTNTYREWGKNILVTFY